MINLVIALKCEANPLIRRYGLKAEVKIHGFPVYRHQEMRLILSGPGKTAAREAVVSLSELSKCKNEAWLNLGIAGSGEFPVGSGMLAHKITDGASQKNWYPPIVFQSPCETANVLTVEHVEKKYDGGWVYDMEAAGFYGAAVCHSPAELIHCYKVISDNLHFPTRNISAALVEHLIENNLEIMDNLIQKISALSNQLSIIKEEPEELAAFLKHWHFTVSERHQLKKRLKRWKALQVEENIWSSELKNLTCAKEVIRLLDHRLAKQPVLL